MKKVVVASENPIKIEVAKRAFEIVFPNEKFEFVAMKSDSGVPDQPMEDETHEGARNRLTFIKEKNPDADFWVGQEGGLFKDEDRLFNRAWIVIEDKEHFIAEASTSSFYIPKKISEYVQGGMELGHASDKFFETQHISRHGGGSIGKVTDGVVTRTEFYLQAAIIALSEIKHKDWYQ